MSLRLHDTATRSTRDFVPQVPGRASVYVCGATVQAAPHIGHIRSGVSFDILQRWLAASGYEVTFLRNVTDIDDKILARASEESRPWWAVAAHFERSFAEAYAILGCLPPTLEPRATGHVPAMITLMRRLIDAGHAYASDGDVYFDVASFPEYGALSGQRMSDVQPAADADSNARKRDPRDFALWKGTRDDGPGWETPWGVGRPGWHLECSAMASMYLGATFDIHGGGLDLVFPHHENEIAQSRAVGDGFAQYWMHNAWVTTAGEKMSKSLGNSLLVTEVVKRVRPVELRFYLGSAHYRSHIEFSEGAMADAAAGYRRLEGFVHRAVERLGRAQIAVPGGLPAPFVAAMDDDLGVPAALAVVHETVSEGNRMLADRTGSDAELVAVVGSVRAMLDILGVDPLDPTWAGDTGTADAAHDALDALITQRLAARQAAREARDFAAADAVRDSLRAAGVLIEDTPDGPRWSLEA
ncbi:MAG TPA: cysteine--tRNA ligase [Motilibacterales bacterium]|nr:cysteine--tRNA ligase [Motilibacterales bacterium]